VEARRLYARENRDSNERALQFAEKLEKQIPRRLKPARDDKK
jgi:hypothetical protein